MKAEGIKPNYSALGKIYNMDRRTVKKQYLEIENQKEKKERISKLDKYQKIIKEKLNIPGSNKKAVYMFLKNEIDEDIGSYSNFRKYTFKHKDLFISKTNDIHLRFETEMGKQLQFDWKGPIKLFNKSNVEFEFYIFSATLCASRMHTYFYSKFLTLESVESCLIKTFEYLNGVPQECLTDNMACILTYDKSDFNNDFKNFAKDIGFIPKKCKKFSPETKGKDESCNRFVNWLLPYNKEFEDENDLIKIILQITNQVNSEVSQTTNMKRTTLFRKEKEYLQPLPKEQIINKYLDNNMLPAKVTNELLIYYKGCKYSVPKKYINQTVKLKEIDNKLFIYYNKELITTHEITNQKINYKEEHYVEALKETIPYKKDTEIKEMAKKNLELLGKILKKKEGKNK